MDVGFLHEDFTVCPGCEQCNPGARPEVVPDLVASESLASVLHQSFMNLAPASVLGDLAREADARGEGIDSVASEKMARVFRKVRRFGRSLRREAKARCLEPEELLVRMILTGSMGARVSS